jgi:hypothetical protein
MLSFQQQHPQQPPPLAFSAKASNSGGLAPTGLFPCSDSSSSKKKHYIIVSVANENTVMKQAPTIYPIIPATTQGK